MRPVAVPSRLLALAFTICCGAISISGAAAEPWFVPSTIMPQQDTDDGFYQQNILTFLEATRLSYTATYGGYFVPADINATIPSWANGGGGGGDWIRLLQPSFNPNPKFGMHAVSFLQASSKRILVAFRGTDLTQCESGFADQCADMLLWSGLYTYATLPKDMCGNFSESVLAYFEDARALVANIAATYPSSEGYQMMLTGHSLGAGLATIVAATAQQASTRNSGCFSTSPALDTSEPQQEKERAAVVPNIAGSIVFSSPAFVETLMNKTNTSVAQLNLNRTVFFADAFDPVYYMANRGAKGGLAGNICLFHNGTESAFCKKCEVPTNNNPLQPTVDCEMCLYERHIFSHYIRLVDPAGGDGSNVPVIPRCEPQPKQECSSSLGNCAPRGRC